MDEEKLVERFVDYLRSEKRSSELTVTTYDGVLRKFNSFLSSLCDLRTLVNADADNIRAWMEQMMDDGNKATQINKCLSTLHSFYKFCLIHGIREDDPSRGINGPKKEKRLPEFVREREMDQLLEMMQEQSGESFSKLRARTIIYILYVTGMRKAEILSLDDSMIDLVSREIKVTGKRNKQRIIPFGEDLALVLKAYTSRRDNEISRKDDAFLVKDNGERLPYHQLLKIVKDNLRLVTTLSRVSPHVLRHSFATAMLNHNANLESVKKLLGHQSLRTTEIYTHVTFEKLKEVYNDAHPRS